MVKKERYRHIQITRTNGKIQYSLEGRISPKTEKLIISLLHSWHVYLVRSVTRSESNIILEKPELEDHTLEDVPEDDEQTIWELAFTPGTQENKLLTKELEKRGVIP